MYIDPNVEHVRTYTRPALEGREFSLRVRLLDGVTITTIKERDFERILKQALEWQGKATSASIIDYRQKVIVPVPMMTRLWAANSGCYGIRTEATPFLIIGPTINPTFIERWEANTIYGSLRFAINWASSDEDPYWIRIRGPNGRVVIGQKEVERLYHSTYGAAGGSITISVVRPSDTILVAQDGSAAVRLPEILSTKQVV